MCIWLRGVKYCLLFYLMCLWSYFVYNVACIKLIKTAEYTNVDILLNNYK